MFDAEMGELPGSIHFELPRSDGMFWDKWDGSLSVARDNDGHTPCFDPKIAERLTSGASRVLKSTASRSPDGRTWIGDASTNQILMMTVRDREEVRPM